MRVCSLALLLFGVSWQAGAAPLRFTHVLALPNAAVPIPMQLSLSAVGDNVISVKVAGNLQALQAELPRLLSRDFDERCRRHIGVAVETVRASGATLKATGTVTAVFYRCSNADDPATRQEVRRKVIGFSALIDGRVEDNCMNGELVDLSISPGGSLAGVTTFLGLDGWIAARARQAINEAVESELDCIDLPTKLKVLDTRISSASFTDLGEGRMGFMVQGRIDVRAQNVVRLVGLLAREGALRN